MELSVVEGMLFNRTSFEGGRVTFLTTADFPAVQRVVVICGSNASVLPVVVGSVLVGNALSSGTSASGKAHHVAALPITCRENLGL